MTSNTRWGALSVVTAREMRLRAESAQVRLFPRAGAQITLYSLVGGVARAKGAAESQRRSERRRLDPRGAVDQGARERARPVRRRGSHSFVEGPVVLQRAPAWIGGRDLVAQVRRDLGGRARRAPQAHLVDDPVEDPARRLSVVGDSRPDAERVLLPAVTIDERSACRVGRYDPAVDGGGRTRRRSWQRPPLPRCSPAAPPARAGRTAPTSWAAVPTCCSKRRS